MIKAVFFDVGGTLIAPYPSVGAIYSEVAGRHGISLTPEVLNLRFRKAWGKQKSRRALVDKSWWRAVVDDIFEGSSFKDQNGFFEELYREFEKKDSWRLFPDVIETLAQLRERGIRLAVASNWDERLPALLKTLGLAPYFERQFISFDLKISKPDVRFFNHALQTMGLKPLEALHVGDDPVEDIEGAQKAGLRAYRIDRIHKPKNSRTLSSLDEILLRL